MTTASTPLPPPAAAPIAWARLLPGVLLVAAVLLLFRDTAVAMVTIWVRSETFTHCFLVPPIVAWLIWRRRERLAVLPARPAPWVLLGVLTTCLLWLVGELASVNAATQLALVVLIALVVPAVYGIAVARELTFPLLFLLFSVPLGEFLVPSMMDWTADFTVAALQASGLPVYREGLQFVIPSGHWSVVEACSGVRYLIASFMVGTLFAYLNFSTARKRWIFALLSLLVPLVANWLRAYMIVMLGHLSGNVLAAGVDHIIYGWVFFGIVIGIMFVVGARYGDMDAAHPPPLPQCGLATLFADAGSRRAGSSHPVARWLVVAAAAGMMLATQGLQWQLSLGGASDPVLALPADLGPWQGQAIDDAPGRWKPAFQNASVVAERRYTNGAQGGAEVRVWVGYYRNQNYERKLVTSTNGLAEGRHDPAWAVASHGSTTAATGLGVTALRTAELRDAVVATTPRLRVWQVYWVGGNWTTSDARAKLALATEKLLGRGDDGAVVLIYTPLAPGAPPQTADNLLRSFVEQELGALHQALSSTQARR
jgi:exosortase A